jgi:DNA-binding IclR family transcriptional regulator
MKDKRGDATERHSVPVIDRMMDILDQIEQRSDGPTITDLTAVLEMPRTSIYRILNTLQRHEVVRRDREGRYFLGPRLLRLASNMATQASELDLPKLAQPIMDRLADRLGEGVKLSILDGRGVLVVAVAQGRREYALTVTTGQVIPVHVGAAAKVLLAHLPKALREAKLSQDRLEAFTGKTLTDIARLERELERIARQGWAGDLGEHSSSINAVAAPVIDPNGTVVAALSVPFLAGRDKARIEEIRAATIEAARQLGAKLSVHPNPA